MKHVLVIYYSRTGHTQEMANAIAQGAQLAGAQADCRSVYDVDIAQLVNYDAIILGSPSYYGSMAADVKKFLDSTISLHGKLRGKVGGAFCSSARVSGGNETTLLSILHAFLVHGMILTGGTPTYPYGPVAIHAPNDDATREECLAYGRMIAELAAKLSP
ncbi:MAG: flavodoxin domain-containing protein [bacterium]|nr:flavodoxin domain-containing protein [bacterium]